MRGTSNSWLQTSWLGGAPVWAGATLDLLIAICCYLLLALLVSIMRARRDVPFNGVFYGLAAFLLGCGTSYGIDAATLWHPLFWMMGVSRALTATTALMTLYMLVRYKPQIEAMPSRAELQKALWQLDSLLESTSTCVLALGPAWQIDYLNRRARSVLKVQGDAALRTLWEVFPPGTPDSRDKLLQVMERREPASYEEYSETLGLWTTVRAHPWDNGGITLFFNDESEQRELQRELRLHGLRDQRIEILARLSGELAHEIKNPLAIIHARASDLAELTAAGPTVPADVVANSCTSIVKTSDRALRILRGLAALAREGSSDPMQQCDLQTIVDQTVDVVEPRCRTHGIRLEIAIAPGLPQVECREVQIGQVLMNLLSNAFDAVNLLPESERWVRVEVSLDPAGSGEGPILMDVLDGGHGVAEQAKGQIMQSFYTTKAVGAGIGIGLSVSRAIAQDHNGSLELLEKDGHTCFRLTIPVRSSQGTREGVAA